MTAGRGPGWRSGILLVGVLAAGVLTGAAAGPARASEPTVDMTLVLALDTSASVDAEEYAQQRGGLAAAFRDREVVEAIAAGPLKRIAVAVMERAIPTGATSIAGALSFGTALLRAAPFDTGRRVIDLSGDGRNNQGRRVEDVRRIVVAQGVTINALAILNEHPTLNYYFEDRVIGGTGAFVEIANDYRDYVGAIRRKLIREIRSLTVSDAGPESPGPEAPGPGRALPLPESRVRLAAVPPPSR